MLRAQVKRLCSENNWLRTELADHQQLLQETEVELARVKEEKDQLEFTLHNMKVMLRRTKGGEGGEGEREKDTVGWEIFMQQDFLPGGGEIGLGGDNSKRGTVFIYILMFVYMYSYKISGGEIYEGGYPGVPGSSI